MVFRVILGLFRRDEGQDLSEWCLITALIALIALGIFWHISGGMGALWNNSNTSIANAGTAVGAGATAGPGGTGAATGTQNGDAHADHH